MEIDINKISVAHKKDFVIKIFDNPDECLKFCEEASAYGSELSADSLAAFLGQFGARCELKGMSIGRKTHEISGFR